MANVWSTPHQRDNVTSVPDDPIPAGQQQHAVQPDANPVFQNCLCTICSKTRNADSQMTMSTIENQDPTPPIESVAPYANQIVGRAHPTAIAATVGYPGPLATQTWSVAPQALYQENPGYAPQHDVVDPPQVQMGTVPDEEGTLDLSVPERLRRLAGRYVNNPDSIVSGVYLEHGPSGRFQIVITMDIGDILGDTTN